MEEVLSYHSFFLTCCKPPLNASFQVGCWQPSLENFFKLNTDGVLFFDCQEVGLVAILRDSRGEVIMAASMREKIMFQPETTECVAIFRGIQQCIPLGIPNLVLESDYQTIVQQIQGLAEPFLPLGNIIEDIKKMLSTFQSGTGLVMKQHMVSQNMHGTSRILPYGMGLPLIF